MWLFLALLDLSAAHPSPAPDPKDIVTNLSISIVDGVTWHFSCDGVVAHQVKIEVDGRPVGEVTVPCSTTFQVPARRFPLPNRVALGPGKHVLRALDRTTRKRAMINLQLPKLIPFDEGGQSYLAEYLDLHLEASGLGFGPLRGFTFTL